MSSCSKVPDGLKPRTPASRIASLTCGGAALSAKIQDQTSVLSGPRGCHTRKLREVARSIEKFGNIVPTIGLISFARATEPLVHLRANLLLVFQNLGHWRIADIVRPDADQNVAITGRDHAAG